MAETKIEWAHYTFNPWLGCSKVSAACKNCYAEAWAKRSGIVQWGDSAERRRTSESNWRQPLKWNREAEKAGERRRVFCASLADVFEDRPELAPWRLDLLKLIVQTGNLDWLLLTKRPQNVMRMIEEAQALAGAEKSARAWLLRNPHVRIGTTVENQEMADLRIPELLKIPAPNFLSIEPMLGPISIPHAARWHFEDCACLECFDRRVRSGEQVGIDWVICGGESGPNARPMHPDWARSLRDQCKTAGVAFHFKQWGVWVPDCRGAQDENLNGHLAEFRKLSGSGRLQRHHWPDGSQSHLFSKKAAGRLLDGRTWDEFPEVSR